MANSQSPKQHHVHLKISPPHEVLPTAGKQRTRPQIAHRPGSPELFEHELICMFYRLEFKKQLDQSADIMFREEEEGGRGKKKNMFSYYKAD